MRISAAEGIVSGVWVCAWIVRNWERSAPISVGVNPADKRRSKPRGAECVLVDADDEEDTEELPS